MPLNQDLSQYCSQSIRQEWGHFKLKWKMIQVYYHDSWQRVSKSLGDPLPSSFIDHLQTLHPPWCKPELVINHLPCKSFNKLTHQMAAHLLQIKFNSVQSLSRVQLCNPMNHSTPGLPVQHQLPESTQTQLHRVSNAIQPSHPLSSLPPPALSLSQHQGLFQWVSSSHQVAKVLKFQLQHLSL